VNRIVNTAETKGYVHDAARHVIGRFETDQEARAALRIRHDQKGEEGPLVIWHDAGPDDLMYKEGYRSYSPHWARPFKRLSEDGTANRRDYTVIRADATQETITFEVTKNSDGTWYATAPGLGRSRDHEYWVQAIRELCDAHFATAVGRIRLSDANDFR
jgi:hypothetical protein